VEKVVISSVNKYDIALIKEKIRFIFQRCDFFKRVSKDEKIFLKVNLLTLASVESAICTNPVFVESVIEVLKENGYKELSCGDSPGVGSPEKAAKASGIYEVLKRKNIRFVSIEKEERFRTINNHRRKYIYLYQGLKNIDTIINLPKLKTHCLMTMTLGVKNFYGLLPGKANKVDGHMRENTPEKFARYLMDIFETISGQVKVFTLIDGIIGMEGDGPSSGTPMKTKLIAGSFNTQLLDFFILRWCGLTLDEYPLYQISEKKEEIKEKTDVLIKENGTFHRKIKRPRKGDVSFNVPVILSDLYNMFFYTYPEIDQKRCLRCRVCVESCPVGTIKGRDNIIIEDKKCIRCFCCHELCPHEAIVLKQTLPLRLLKRLVSIFQRITGI